MVLLVVAKDVGAGGAAVYRGAGEILVSFGQSAGIAHLLGT